MYYIMIDFEDFEKLREKTSYPIILYFLFLYIF